MRHNRLVRFFCDLEHKFKWMLLEVDVTRGENLAWYPLLIKKEPTECVFFCVVHSGRCESIQGLKESK